MVQTKQSQLSTASFYKDTPAKINVADPTLAGANGNAGLRERYVFSKTSGTIEMAGPYLKIRKVKVSPSVSVAHELASKKGPATYPIRHMQCESFVIPAGNLSQRKDNLWCLL